MHKILSLLLSSLLFSKEPTLGILESIQTNTEQIFIIAQKRYRCDAYGVLGIEKLFQRSELSEVCKTKMQDFYAKHPDAKYFAYKKLKRSQMYHIEFRESECLLFASGEITLSELLLKEGFALLNPMFDDKEFRRVYKDAQAAAIFEKRGIWRDNTTRECAAALETK